MAMDLRLSGLVRAAGTGMAAALPLESRARRLKQAVLVGAAEAAAHRIEPGGVTFFSITPDPDEEPSLPKLALAEGTRTGSWIAVNLLAGLALRRATSRLGRLWVALAAAVFVYALDEGASRMLAKALAAKAEAEARAEHQAEAQEAADVAGNG